jgi:hypothetical protein
MPLAISYLWSVLDFEMVLKSDPQFGMSSNKMTPESSQSLSIMHQHFCVLLLWHTICTHHATFIPTVGIKNIILLFVIPMTADEFEAEREPIVIVFIVGLVQQI